MIIFRCYQCKQLIDMANPSDVRLNACHNCCKAICNDYGCYDACYECNDIYCIECAKNKLINCNSCDICEECHSTMCCGHRCDIEKHNCIMCWRSCCDKCALTIKLGTTCNECLFNIYQLCYKSKLPKELWNIIFEYADMPKIMKWLKLYLFNLNL